VVTATIFCWTIIAVCSWVVIYASILFGFLTYPSRKPSVWHPAIGTLGYATAIWLYCIGILLMGYYVFALLIVIMLVLVFLFVRRTKAQG
jgi:hypothetical protein